MADIIKKQPHCDITAMDSASCFQAVYNAAIYDGTFSENEAADVQRQLWQLLGRQTDRYTMGDSSSVRIELSQELFRSVCYSVGLYFQQAGGGRQATEQLRYKTMESLFKMGQETLKEFVSEGAALLLKLQQDCIRVNNIAYHDTVFEALPKFFKYYDMRFFAHETPCDIDYQLCIAVPDLGGIAYVNAYMRRLQLENAFCSNFRPDLIERLLEGFCPDHVQQLINIFEPVFINAVGLALLNKDMRTLNMAAADRAALQNMLQSKDAASIKGCIARAVGSVCAALDIQSPDLSGYLREAQQQLFVRLVRQLEQGGLEALFISFKKEAAKKSKILYRDGKPMPDEALRELIGEMRTCRHLSDKIAMIKEHVRSLCDLVEVMNACFFDNEFIFVFKMLKDTELSVLWKYLVEIKDGALFDRSQNADWENAFLDYIGRMEKTRAKNIQRGML